MRSINNVYKICTQYKMGSLVSFSSCRIYEVIWKYILYTHRLKVDY